MDVSLFKDLVDLARNGYKPSDVKELITMMKEEPEKKEPEKEEPEKKEPEKKEPDKKELLDAFAKLVEDNK